MTDISKLKALAEAATPGRNFDRYPEAGGGLKYECTGDDGSLVLKVDHKNDEWGFVGDKGEQDEAFFLACTPAAVLELIAELESYQVGAKVEADAGDEARSEVRKLKAENERLRKKADCVDDCAHLIRKLVHCRRKLATDGTLAEKALDYLKRKGLQGSPLREESAQ